MEMSEIETYRCAGLVLQQPDPDAFIARRIAELHGDEKEIAVWRKIALAMEVLRVIGSLDGHTIH